MKHRIQCAQSAEAAALYPGSSLTVVVGWDVPQPRLLESLQDRRDVFLDRLNAEWDLLQLRIQHVSDFFVAQSARCPLPSQLTQARKRGLPRIAAPVDALLWAELTNGVLMGVQDATAMRWPLTYDVARSNEHFQGFRGPVTCVEGELLVRDADTIIASVLRGPDSKTKVTDASTSLAYYVFGLPGSDQVAHNSATSSIEHLLTDAGAAVESLTCPP